MNENTGREGKKTTEEGSELIKSLHCGDKVEQHPGLDRVN